MAASISTCGRNLFALTRKTSCGVGNISQKYREYARSFRRKPVAVLSAEEERQQHSSKRYRDRIQDFDVRDPVLQNIPRPNELKRITMPRVVDHRMDDSDFYKDALKDRRKEKLERKTQLQGKKVPNKSAKPDRVEEEHDGVKYVVLHERDHKFGPVLMSARSKKDRDRKRQILLEGTRLISDVLNSGLTPKSVFFHSFDVLKKLPPACLENLPLYKCRNQQMKLWSDTTTPPGILAIFDMPEDGEVAFKYENPTPLTVILDQIRDPGNMGTLLRSSAAVGCEQVITMKGCVDIWEPKVLRSGAGSHFRVPVYRGVAWEQVENLLPENAGIYVADKRRPTDKREAHYTNLTDEGSEMVTEEQENEYVDDPDDEEKLINKSFTDPLLLKKYWDAPLTVTNYNDIDYRKKDHSILVIGGETWGVSLEARKLAFDKYGQCVMIPMREGLESLNAAMAGTLLMYEIYNQCGQQIKSELNSDSSSEMVSDEEEK